MNKIYLLSVVILLSLLKTTEAQVSLVSFSTGFTQPVDVKNAGDSRLFIVERAGYIKIIDTLGAHRPGIFLDIHLEVESSYNEEGLLGLAFPPDYQSTGYFYCYYTQKNTWAVRVSRFSVSGSNPDSADAASEQPLITIYHHFAQNHDGGGMAFGPDGYLYFGTGDGGSANDPGNRAQNLDSLLGKMMRIDVSGGGAYLIPPTNPFVGQPGARGEIWAYGLRNPWRWSFDSWTGDLWIGDVGQNVWEEVDYQPASSTGGENYGWHCYEGNVHTSGVTPQCSPTDAVFPVLAKNHSTGMIAIIGGYVYRGAEFSNMFGKYYYSDESTSSIGVRSITHINNNFYDSAAVTHGGTFVSMGEDIWDEMYVADIGGTIYKFQGTSCSPVAHLADEDSIYLCGGSTFLMRTPEGKRFTYAWSFNGTPISGADSASYLATQPGTYSLSVTNRSSCTTTNTLFLTFDPVINNLDTMYCINHSAFPLSGFPHGGTFKVDGIAAVNFDPAALGVGLHSITYSYTDSMACSDSVSKVVNVNACLGVAEYPFLSNLSIYPDPSSGDFVFSCVVIKNEIMQVEITDLLGKKVGEEKYTLAAGTHHIPLHLQVESGIYYLKASTAEGSKVVRFMLNSN